MKQATLKLKNYAKNVDVVNNNELQRRILNILFWSLGAFAISYALLMGKMIFNIVERKALEANARTLSNEVGSLELQYLAFSDKVDLNLASSMGFKETTEKSFATRESLGSIKLTSNEL